VSGQAPCAKADRSQSSVAMPRLRDRSSQKKPSSYCKFSGLSPIPESKGIGQLPFGCGDGAGRPCGALPFSLAQLKGANTFALALA
jgi:hypothetical protein